MPLTDEERQWLAQTLGQTPSQPTATADPFGIPAGAPYPVSTQIGKTRLAIPPPLAETQRQLLQKEEELKLARRYPAQTEMERERGQMSRTALAFVDDFARQLGVDEKIGTVSNPELLSYSRELLPKAAQEAFHTSKTRQLYNSLDSAFQEAAIVLTGRQGDVQKLKQLQDLYRFGAFVRKDPSTIIKRIQNLKQLIQTFDNPQVSNEQLSQQMDTLLGDTNPYLAEARRRGLIK